MKKLVVFGGLALIIVLVAFFLSNNRTYQQKQEVAIKDHKNADYVIDGKRIALVNGISETDAAPGSASKIVTRYFGNEVRKDIDGDGKEDIVFLLTQETGGSGTFFYVVGAVFRGDSGYVGTQAVLLGDRIAPQTTESGPGRSITVNYADRARGESFTVRPSVGKSLRLLLNPESMQFGEVAQNFEGEADPARMTLGMKTWYWVLLSYPDGREVTPNASGKFTISFSDAGRFAATTDCNSLSGSYSDDGKAITFGQIASTKMYCEASQESVFASILSNAEGYRFTSKGEFIIEQKDGGAYAVFR